MDNYRVSIIVSVYNTKKYLGRCAGALTGQHYDNLEVILVDDGSKDGSGELCDTLAQRDCRIRVIHKENGGLVSAWKRGVKESTGDYLCFVDSDDWVDTNMIEEMAACLSGNPREIIASDYVIERGNGRRKYVWQQLPPGEYGRKQMEGEVIPNLLGRESRYVAISRCMKLIARGLIEDNCQYAHPSIRMGEDITVMLPALIDCERLVIMEHKAYYHYLYVADSMSHGYDSLLWENIKRLRGIILRILEDKFDGKTLESMQKKADQEHIFMLMLVLKNEARGNRRGYMENIRKVCLDHETRRLIRNTPVQVSEKSNRLLYMAMKHPNIMNLLLLRLAMVVYYKGHGKQA